MKAKLAEALLRRKELNGKVAQLAQIRQDALFEVRVNRKRATEDMDDIVATVPKLTASQVTAEYDYYASMLRRVDAAIQQANWQTDIELPDSAMRPWEASKQD